MSDEQKSNFLLIKTDWDSANSELVSAIEEVDLFVDNDALCKLTSLQGELSQEAFISTIKMIEMIFESDDLKVHKVHAYHLEVDTRLRDIVSDIQWLVNDLRRDAFKLG